MSKIISVSRQFGSGGRELGKRLADELSVPCYDHEIIDMVAEKYGYDKNYAAHVSETDIRAYYPSTIGRRFVVPHPALQEPIKITAAQQDIIRRLAEEGDCVIIGRGADVILRNMKPFKIFVYADTESKLTRCRERAEKGKHLSDKEIVRNMRSIDKERSGYHDLLSESKWGDKAAYHLCVNTSGLEIKSIVPIIAEYAKIWFK